MSLFKRRVWTGTLWRGRGLVDLVLNALTCTVGLGAMTLGTTSYAIPTDGSARYVSTTGSDSNDGLSAATPWLTLDKVASAAPSGATVVFRGGVYHFGRNFVNSSSSTNSAYLAIVLSQSNLTIQSYPGETVWFDGSSVIATGSFTADSGYYSMAWTPFRRDLTNYASSYPPAGDNWSSLDDSTLGWTYVDYTNYPTAGRPERLWIDGVALQQVATLAQMGAGKFFADAYNNKLYIPINPSGHVVELTTYQTLMNSLGTNFILRGVGIRRYAPSLPQFGAVKVHRPNARVENVIFEDISGKAFSVIGDPNTVNGSNNFAGYRITVTRAGNLGMHVDQVDNFTITDSKFFQCNDAHFNYAPDAGSIKCTKVRGINVYRNEFREAYGKGFWADVDNRDVYVVNNDFIDCEQRGTVYELTRNVNDFGSRHVNGGAEGIVFMDSESARVYNASFYGLGWMRGVTSGGVVQGCTGIAIFTDGRAGAKADGTSRISYHDSTSRMASWPTPMTSRYMMASMEVKNCIFGPSDYESYWRDQILGSDPAATDGGSTIVRAWTADGLSFDYNYYNGHSSKQVHTRTYPFVLRAGGSAGSNTIAYNVTNLRSLTSARIQEAHGLEFVDVDRMTAAGYLASAYASAANAAATPLPSDVATIMGVAPGAQLMGPLGRN